MSIYIVFRDTIHRLGKTSEVVFVYKDLENAQKHLGDSASYDDYAVIYRVERYEIKDIPPLVD